MKAIILRDSEGFFDDPKESEDLQITIRIACEFFVFLRQSKDVPELDEAEYMAGTIRSGLDWFFSMAHTGGMLTGLKLQSGFGPKLPSSFPELKALTTLSSTKCLNLPTVSRRLGCCCHSCR